MAKKRKPQLWLFKEEPTHYNFAELEKDGKTVWDGVTNALAQKHLREVRSGDRVLYYHTGKERAIVGEMSVISEPRPAQDEDRCVVVDVEVVQRIHPVTLADIKKEASLKDWALVRLPRLSIVPVTQEQWDRIMEMSSDLSKAANEQ